MPIKQMTQGHGGKSKRKSKTQKRVDEIDRKNMDAYTKRLDKLQTHKSWVDKEGRKMSGAWADIKKDKENLRKLKLKKGGSLWRKKPKRKKK